MKMPGFTAELSLGWHAGTYCRLGAKSPQLVPLSGFKIQPALPRATQCTTVYSGYVTYPQRVCEPRHSPQVVNAGRAANGTSRLGGVSGQAGLSHVESFSRVCRTHYGPWLAYVVRQEHCDFRQPDDFTLTIVGVPQPVELRWTGTLRDAPNIVGAIGNVFPTVPTCSCCGNRKQCPNGSCVPPTSPCGPGSPA
jgi:hypothetical protein